MSKSSRETPTESAPISIASLRAAVWSATEAETRSDFDLAPEARAELPPSRKLHPAAVICVVTPREEGLQVILTRRADHLKKHAGQIAFPGGKVDVEDRSPLAAALREAQEEIGLTPDLVEVVGALDRYETRTGFMVTPFVGVACPSFQPLINDGEVAEIFETPLDFLMNHQNILTVSRVIEGKPRPFYAIPWRDRYIWGATAAMLKSLADRIAATRDLA